RYWSSDVCYSDLACRRVLDRCIPTHSDWHRGAGAHQRHHRDPRLPLGGKEHLPTLAQGLRKGPQLGLGPSAFLVHSPVASCLAPSRSSLQALQAPPNTWQTAPGAEHYFCAGGGCLRYPWLRSLLVCWRCI